MSRAVLNVYFGGDQDAFINWIKGGQGYGGNVSNLNQYGCPATTPPDAEISAHAWRMQIDLPSTSVYSGHWVLKFQGTGGVQIVSDGGTITPITSTGTVGGSGSTLTLTGTNPRVEFSVSSTGGFGWFVQMLGGSTVYSNMKGPVLVRLSDEAAYDAGEFFNPDFITQLKAINPLALRVMQYVQTSAFEQTSSMPLTHMPSLDYITWGISTSGHFPLSCNVGAISGTNTYTCSSAPDTPGSITAGETVWGVDANTNTITTATLNIGGRGSKKILHHNAQAISVGEVGAGFGVFIYDPNADGYIYSASPMLTGVPTNVMVALCNEVGCGLWYTVNVLIPDSEVTLLSQYFRDNLNDTLYLEWGNEIWGGVPMPADLVQTWANINSTGIAQMYGYELRRVMGLATSAWTPRSLASLKRIAAWQAFGALPDFNIDTLLGQTSALMTGLGWDTAPNRPVDFLDMLSFATYYQGPSVPAFQGGYTGTTSGVQAGLYTAADNYASGDPTLMASALDWMDNDIRQGTGGNGDFQTLLSLRAGPIVVNGQAGAYNGWEALAASYDASRPTNKLKVINYEGGLQIAPPSPGTLSGLGVNTAYAAKIATMFNAYKNDARCKRLVFDQLNQFMVNSHSFAPAWYAFCGDVSQWSTHTSDLYSTKFKSFDALVQFNGIVTPGPKNIKDGF